MAQTLIELKQKINHLQNELDEQIRILNFYRENPMEEIYAEIESMRCSNAFTSKDIVSKVLEMVKRIENGQEI